MGWIKTKTRDPKEKVSGRCYKKNTRKSIEKKVGKIGVISGADFLLHVLGFFGGPPFFSLVCEVGQVVLSVSVLDHLAEDGGEVGHPHVGVL